MPIKEVRLGSQGPDIRMEPQELQQSPGAPLFNPNNQSLRQPARGRPLLPRAVALQSGMSSLSSRARPVPLRPSRPGQQKSARGGVRVVRELRLAASGEEVDQREAEDAQRGGDGEAVEEPPQLRARGVEALVLVGVKRCHASVIRARGVAILPRAELTSEPRDHPSNSRRVCQRAPLSSSVMLLRVRSALWQPPSAGNPPLLATPPLITSNQPTTRHES